MWNTLHQPNHKEQSHIRCGHRQWWWWWWWGQKPPQPRLFSCHLINWSSMHLKLTVFGFSLQCVINATRQPYRIFFSILIKRINNISVCASVAHHLWTLRMLFHSFFIHFNLFTLDICASIRFIRLLCPLCVCCRCCGDLPIITIDLFMRTRFECVEEKNRQISQNRVID